MCEVRLLRANEIEARTQSVQEKGAVLLLYKDARCDMAILDETFGMRGWQRRHSFKDGNNYCTVSIWDAEKGAWIEKEDVGTESNTEKEKGQASDAFKRACVNVGIGRELYTSPFIYVSLADDEVQKNGSSFRLNPRVKFRVNKIEYNDRREISGLEIIDNHNNVRYSFPAKHREQKPAPEAPKPQKKKSISMKEVDSPVTSESLYWWLYQAECTYGKGFNFIDYTCQHYDITPDAVAAFSAGYSNYRDKKRGLVK